MFICRKLKKCCIAKARVYTQLIMVNGSEAIAQSSERIFNQQLHTFGSHAKIPARWHKSRKKCCSSRLFGVCVAKPLNDNIH